MKFAVSVRTDFLKPFVPYLPEALHPLVKAPLENVLLWTGLAWMETVQSYRRTMLGPFWITCNLAIFTLAMTYVYGALFSIPTKEYAAYLACGMIAWTWIGALINEVGNTFITYSGFIKNTSITKSIFVWSTVYKQIIIFAHNLIVFAGLALVGVIDLTVHTLMLVPVLVVMFAISIPITGILALLFARYRDLPRLVSSLMIVLMMVTPIFWQVHMFSGWRTMVFLFNPIYYLVEFLRAPLLGQPEQPLIVAGVLGLLVLAWAIGARFYRRYEKYVVFWL